MGCPELPIEYFTEAEEVAGKYYYGYRFYSAELGRWLTRDPINEQRIASFNGNILFFKKVGDIDIFLWETDYIFDNNNAFMRIDYLGLNPHDCAPCATGDIMGTRQKDDYIAETNGCTGVPDDPMLATPPYFKSCSSLHVMVTMCIMGHATKLDHPVMLVFVTQCSQCANTYFPGFFNSIARRVFLELCQAEASIYATVVEQIGDSFCEDGQKEACESCCCPKNN